MDLSVLNEPQQIAATHIDGPLLILAGAGSGKTKTLVYRMAYMIENGISARNILAITFTNKAAKEMKNRTVALLKKSCTPHISTFHSFAVSVLRQTCTELGYQKGFQIYDEEESKKLLKETIKNIAEQNIIIDNTKVTDIEPEQYISYFSFAKDNLLYPGELSQNFEDINPMVDHVYLEYQKNLLTNNAMDFDDLIFNCVRIFQKPHFLNGFQSIYKYIMVDEYQDTSHAQFEMIRLLAEKYKNICVVGDDYQSIYKFRGADITNILNFQNQYPEALSVTLGINYRSTEDIVDGAAAVIAHNTKQLHKDLVSFRGIGNKITISEYQDPRDESFNCVQHIMDEVEKGKKYSDFTFLYRQNAMSRAIEERLLKENIPYRIFGGLCFYQRAEVKDIMAYLKVIYLAVPDNISVERIINTPKRGIGKTTVDKLRHTAHDNKTDMMSAARLSTNANVKSFVELIDSLKEFADTHTPNETYEEIVDRIDYTAYLVSIRKENENISNKIYNINELNTAVIEFAQENPDDDNIMQDFFDHVALFTDQDMTEDGDYVSLMSIHRSKGLEFDTVFMVGVEESEHFDEDVEEERRLMYVGMTRAKNSLFISYCKIRFQYGQMLFKQPSKFIDEIPDENIERQQEESEYAE